MVPDGKTIRLHLGRSPCPEVWPRVDACAQNEKPPPVSRRGVSTWLSTSSAELPSFHSILNRDRAGVSCLIARICRERPRPLRGGIDALADGNGTRALRDSRPQIQAHVERGDSLIAIVGRVWQRTHDKRARRYCVALDSDRGRTRAASARRGTRDRDAGRIARDVRRPATL